MNLEIKQPRDQIIYPGQATFTSGTTPGNTPYGLARMFDELLSRDHEDGRATGKPQGVGPEAYLNGTSQGSTPEDARKDGYISGRSKRFIKHPG